MCGDGLTCEQTADGQRCLRGPCDDGVDNDEDGLIDYPNDPGCSTASDLDEADPDVAPACSNDIDDDLDGLTDFGSDAECISAADDFEGPDCSDGIDNDEDGRLDFDRDGNGQPDANRDRECVCAADPLETEQPQCRDKCDNDNDGLIDLEDPGCRNDPEGAMEFNIPQCRDFIDNNGDGRTDYPADPSCRFPDAPLEIDVEEPPQCDDGFDNDGDGRIDYPNDEGCIAAADTNEGASCTTRVIEFPNSTSTSGTTLDGFPENRGDCGFDGDAPEMIHRVQIPYEAFVIADTFGSAFNTVLYARSSCEPENLCQDAAPPAIQNDAGVAQDDVDGGVADGGLAGADGGANDAGLADAGGQPLDVGVGGEDPEPEPCIPGPTQVACNDNLNGVQSRISFIWPGGDLYLFVDGFGRDFGPYRLQVNATYPRGGQCGPDQFAYAACEFGTQCLMDQNLGVPTCQ